VGARPNGGDLAARARVVADRLNPEGRVTPGRDFPGEGCDGPAARLLQCAVAR